MNNNNTYFKKIIEKNKINKIKFKIKLIIIIIIIRAMNKF